jgi:DNA-binding winged helix-turn-helix (wHTH) protein/tetratricopeptide (TPR) repeat protein
MDISVQDKGCYAFGPFRLDPVRRSLRRDGVPVVLTPKLFDMLLYLVENPGRILSKDELLDAVWPGRVVEEANISQTIFTLRRALSDAASGERYIETASGRGYRFIAPVSLEPFQTLQPPTAVPPAPSPEPVIQPAPIPPKPVSRRRLAAAGAALVVAAGVAAWLLRTGIAPHGTPAGTKIVLAEFQNLTADPLFDRALGKALEIDLLQSPFVSIVPEKQVQDTLVLMTRSKDEAVTADLAREICQRRQAGAVVGGTIAALGTRYLLTLTATDCTDGQILSAGKAEVDHRENLVASLDDLVVQLRGKLGESKLSVQKFDFPLAEKRTFSLEALKAYSEGAWFYNHGKRTEAVPLFRHAVELDPDFATAHATLATALDSLHEAAAGEVSMARAYALRDTVSERERLFIVSRYQSMFKRDIAAAIVTLQLWTETYPNDSAPWGNLSSALTWLGRPTEAIEPGKRALDLDPGQEPPYSELCRAYLHAGRIDEAQSVGDRAVAQGVAGDDVHALLLNLAFLKGDRDAVDREMRWAKDKPEERLILVTAGIHAYRMGEVALGDRLFAEAVDRGKAQGLGDYTGPPRARLLIDLGAKDRAAAILQALPPGQDSADYMVSMAEIGDPAEAQAILDRRLAKSPDDTLLTRSFAGEVRAALALRDGKPREAIAALEPARPYELRVYDVMYLRAIAYLAAGDGASAAAEFETILDNPGIDPISPLYPLSRLGLARAERLSGDLPASHRDYQAFLEGWKDADADLPILQAAKAEAAAF